FAKSHFRLVGLRCRAASHDRQVVRHQSEMTFGNQSNPTQVYCAGGPRLPTWPGVCNWVLSPPPCVVVLLGASPVRSGASSFCCSSRNESVGGAGGSPRISRARASA